MCACVRATLVNTQAHYTSDICNNLTHMCNAYSCNNATSTYVCRPFDNNKISVLTQALVSTMTSITAADINTLSAVQTVSKLTYLPFLAAFYLTRAAFPVCHSLEDGCLLINREMGCLLWHALCRVLVRIVLGADNMKAAAYIHSCVLHNSSCLPCHAFDV